MQFSEIAVDTKYDKQIFDKSILFARVRKAILLTLLEQAKIASRRGPTCYAAPIDNSADALWGDFRRVQYAPHERLSSSSGILILDGRRMKRFNDRPWTSSMRGRA